MILLLDHCVWRQTHQALTTAGFTCLTLQELGRVEAKNSEVLAVAKDRGAILITRDRDFTDLAHYPIGSHAGIIWLDITPSAMSEVHRVLCEALRTHTADQLRGALLVVGRATYRLRHERR